MIKNFILFLLIFPIFLFSQEEKKVLTEEKIEDIIKSEFEGALTKEYYYDPKGRRDPFKSLMLTGRERVSECEEGILCMYWDDIQLVGILKYKNVYFAQILSKQNELYLLKEGDVLADGQITKIDLNCVYYRQKVNDPTKIVPYEDVEKCVLKEKTP